MLRRLKPALRIARRGWLRLTTYWHRYLAWPVPLWAVRGHGTFSIGGYRFKFFDVASPLHQWWAREAHGGKWEPEVSRFLTEVIRPGDTVFDIGAYIGPHTLLASRLVGDRGRVYAFEPDPVAREVLIRNVAANGATNVTVLPLAIMDRSGELWLESSELGNGTARIAPTGSVQVRAVPLSEFCRQHAVRPAVIKIDVEGGEAAVLAPTARDVIDHARAVVVEVHAAALREGGVGPERFLGRIAGWKQRVSRLEQRLEGNFIVALS